VSPKRTVDLLASAAPFSPLKEPRPDREGKQVKDKSAQKPWPPHPDRAPQIQSQHRLQHRGSGDVSDEGGDDDSAYRRRGGFRSSPVSVNLLDYDDLNARGIRLGRVQLWRLMRAGQFPRQVKIGSRNAWVESEINAFIAARIAVRDFEAA
jgi:prophage regulatory protein